MIKTFRGLTVFLSFSAVLTAIPSSLSGGRPGKPARSRGHENQETSVKGVVARVAQAYREAGFVLIKYSLGAVGIKEQKSGKILRTGGGFHDSDIDLFIRISRVFPARSIYVVGNAFGYSTFCLSAIFKGAVVDVIDAEVEGEDNRRGSDITRIIARNHYPNVRLTIGFSPQDTPKAVRPEVVNELKGYDLVFIDGLHTDSQIVKDFEGIVPYLAEKCVIVFHDVGLYRMHEGFKAVRERASAIGFDYFVEAVKSTAFGVGLAIRGIDSLKTLLN